MYCPHSSLSMYTSPPHRPHDFNHNVSLLQSLLQSLDGILALGNKTHRSCLECEPFVFGFAVDADHHDPHRRKLLADNCRSLQATDAGHVYIHEDDVRACLADDPQRGHRISGLPDGDELAACKRLQDELAEFGLVIDY